MSAGDLGVYVHVPFCRVRCAYCDFSIVAGVEPRTAELASALLRELAAVRERVGPREVETIHYGGGTPSRVEPSAIERLTREIVAAFDSTVPPQVALEANPEDVTASALDGWLRAGVGRLSVGLQSLDGTALRRLGRPGAAEDGPHALRRARGAGFRDLSADVIFGHPSQSLADWSAELDRLLELDADHWSLYALETTSRTPLVRAIERGELPAPDPDLQADMYELAVERLRSAGFVRYEISNFARPGHASAHNLRYWTDRAYLGLGPSAASYVDGARWTNPRGYGAWLKAVAAEELPPAPGPVDDDARAAEALVLGLRLIEGVDLERLARRHGRGPIAARRVPIERGLAAGLLVGHGTRIALSERGRLIADEVFVDLL